MNQITAAEFKTHCLKLMDVAHTKKESFVITKRGTPIVKMVPYEEEPAVFYGYMKDVTIVNGDLLESDPEQWEADHV